MGLPAPPTGDDQASLRRSPLSALTASTPELSPVIAGKYVLEWEVGQGSMGRVYAATQLGLDRAVAVKIMMDTGEAFRKRFLAEARSLASLNHRNVVSIFDSGELPTGFVYIVMEYLRGETLAEAIGKNDQLELPRVLRIGAQLARGLRAAHRHGIIHRDLKPSNIFLVENDDEGELVKIFDFGIAKIANNDITREGMILGTPSFMAPEQAEAKGIDERADLYSLGCVLYHAIAGRPPFVEGSQVETLRAHLFKEPEPVDKWRASVPGSLNDLIMRLLRKRPDQRFRNADELLEAFKVIAPQIAGDAARAQLADVFGISDIFNAPHTPSIPTVTGTPLSDVHARVGTPPPRAPTPQPAQSSAATLRPAPPPKTDEDVDIISERPVTNPAQPALPRTATPHTTPSRPAVLGHADALAQTDEDFLRPTANDSSLEIAAVDIVNHGAAALINAPTEPDTGRWTLTPQPTPTTSTLPATTILPPDVVLQARKRPSALKSAILAGAAIGLLVGSAVALGIFLDQRRRVKPPAPKPAALIDETLGVSGTKPPPSATATPAASATDAPTTTTTAPPPTTTTATPATTTATPAATKPTATTKPKVKAPVPKVKRPKPVAPR